MKRGSPERSDPSCIEVRWQLLVLMKVTESLKSRSTEMVIWIWVIITLDTQITNILLHLSVFQPMDLMVPVIPHSPHLQVDRIIIIIMVLMW